MLLGFLEVAVHNLLFVRHVYPREIFERRREYGMAVWMSRHPALNLSISDALEALRPHLLRGVIEVIVLALLGPDGAVIEQYSFDVDLNADGGVGATYSDVETQLASALTRIALLEGVAQAVPAGTTFTLLAATHEELLGDVSSGPGGRGVLGLSTGWARVDRGDPEAAFFAAEQEVPNATRDGQRSRVAISPAFKTVQAGPMKISIRRQTWSSHAR